MKDRAIWLDENASHGDDRDVEVAFALMLRFAAELGIKIVALDPNIEPTTSCFTENKGWKSADTGILQVAPCLITYFLSMSHQHFHTIGQHTLVDASDEERPVAYVFGTRMQSGVAMWMYVANGEAIQFHRVENPDEESQALVVAFSMIVSKILPDCIARCPFAEKNKSTQAFRF